MKTCKTEGCNNPVWSKGMCKYHTPKARIVVRRSVEKDNKKQEEVSLMRDFFLSIWAERPHYCENCGKYLGKEPLTYMFDHLLEKGNDKYEHLKYEEENIMLVCLECHDEKSRGFCSELVSSRIEEVKEVFGVV